MPPNMDFNSRSIDSNQTGPHARLVETVTKHIQHPYRQPLRQHNIEAFDRLQQRMQAHPNQKFILDSCCGTGMSTRIFAERFPEHLVVGIDQSAHRLSKQGTITPDNCFFLQANCEDIWRLCVSDNMPFEQHYILYPNPYPKAVHLKRRWHGHPVFPVLAELSESLTLRSNWVTYLEEFAIAWGLLDARKITTSTAGKDQPLTLFEKKYSDSGQILHQLSTEHHSTTTQPPRQ